MNALPYLGIIAIFWIIGIACLHTMSTRIDNQKRIRRHARIMALRLHEDLPGENDASWMVVNRNGSLEEIMLPA